MQSALNTKLEAEQIYLLSNVKYFSEKEKVVSLRWNINVFFLKKSLTAL